MSLWPWCIRENALLCGCLGWEYWISTFINFQQPGKIIFYFNVSFHLSLLDLLYLFVWHSIQALGSRKSLSARTKTALTQNHMFSSLSNSQLQSSCQHLYSSVRVFGINSTRPSMPCCFRIRLFFFLFQTNALFSFRIHFNFSFGHLIETGEFTQNLWSALHVLLIRNKVLIITVINITFKVFEVGKSDIY